MSKESDDKVRILIDPLKMAEGHGIGVQIDGTTHYYSAKAAKQMVMNLATQFGSDGKPKSSEILVVTDCGPKAIESKDAEEILMVVGQLMQSGMLDILGG